MRALWIMVDYLRTCIRSVVKRWLGERGQSYCRYKPVHLIDKHEHYYSQRKPEWLKQEIIRLKAIMPQAGCRTIADICNRRFAATRKVTVGKTFVHQVLQHNQYEIRILRSKLKHAKPEVIQRNLIWGLDLTGKTDSNGKLHALLGIIDHGSRALLHLQALHDKTSRTLLACLSEIITAYGKPKIIRTDNEAIFTSKEFRFGLKQLGIRHQRTDPGCPWQNGRIERLFGTLKQKLDQWIVTGIEQLNVDLTIFQHWYNHVRPHQNLNGQTPAEIWNGICGRVSAQQRGTHRCTPCGCDPYKVPKQEHWFEAWDGLLTGYELRFDIQNRSH